MSGNYFLNQRKSNRTRSTKAFAFITLALFLVCAVIPQKTFAGSNPRYGAIVMDADTGLILYQDNANKKLHPASLTKMMTLLMTFDALKRGKLRLNDRIIISKHAANVVPSKLGLEPGSSIKVEDAIYALVTKSANDIAVALAEHLGRTESNFARMMTRKAHTIGMTNTYFRNASGLHDPRQVSTPRDMAKLSLALVKNYTEYYHYFSTRQFTYQGKTYHNHNRLMSSYAGMDGLKTGYIQASGFNLAATAVRDNRRLIGVVFGGRTSKSRNRHMAKILDEGFKTIHSRKPMLLARNIPVPPKKPEPSIMIAALNTQSNELARSETILSDQEEEESLRWAFLDDPSQNSMFKRMIGEGDYDIAVRKRIETGLIAVSALKGKQPVSYTIKSATPQIQPTPYHQLNLNQDWAIQIGAYTSRDSTNQALARSLSVLPVHLKHARTSIAPVKTDQGWVFRGRLKGYSKNNAYKACEILQDCIAIPPQTNQ